VLRRLVALVWLLSATTAHATYSITAVDLKTRQVGGAGASCVPYEVIRIYSGIPNRGAINAQAQLDDDAQAEATARLAEGLDADAVLAIVTSPERYPKVSAQMQWGIVDINGNAAHATGAEALAFAGDLEGQSADGRFVFTAQGNILTSELVIERARQAFLAGGCDLAEKLVLALEAAGSNGEGDRRCTGMAIPAKSAYVDVTGGAGSLFRVSVPDVSPEDPTAFVRKAFDEYRATHPCMANSADTPPPRSASDNGCACSFPKPSRSARAEWLGVLALFALACRRRYAKNASLPSNAIVGPRESGAQARQHVA
jgi:uncharacterized Ntn-hydrolase superfamily protein